MTPSSNTDPDKRHKRATPMTPACVTLFYSIILMGFLQFIALVPTGMMLVSWSMTPHEVTWMYGKNFLPAARCPTQVACDGNCYARSFTFTPQSGTCTDFTNGSKKEHVFKIIRPRKKSFDDEDTAYFKTNDTCCVHWVDDDKDDLDKLSKQEREQAMQPFLFELGLTWMFMALLGTLLVFVDFLRALYEQCGVSEWVNKKVEEKVGDTLGDTAKHKLEKVVPKSGVDALDDQVKEKTNEKVDEGSAKVAKKLLNCGGYTVGFLVYFGMAFPLNQLIGNMIRVGDPVSTPADTIYLGGGEYGVWKPVSEKFIVAVIGAITNAVVSSFLLLLLGGPIYALVFFYFAVRLIGIEKTPSCASNGKTDLKRTCWFLAFFFPILCLLGFGIIGLYFQMYFTAELSFPTLLFGMPSFTLPRLGFEVPNLPSLGIGISLCFATLIRFITTCFKCRANCFKIAVRMKCCKPNFKLPGIEDLMEKQFGTVIVGYKVFRFQCSKVACGIPFTFWNLFAFLWCCCFRGKCQWPYCGAATFVPKVGVWEVDEEWEANYVDLKELARRKASSVGDGMKNNLRSWSTGGD